MEQLIVVDNDTQTVSARELHEVLEIKERFSLWFSRFTDLFTEDDFTSVGKPTVVNNGAERMLEDYEISVEMAKHISMMCKTEKGKQCRTYFIDLEKAWNTPEQIMARALKMAQKTIDNLAAQVQQSNKVIDTLEPKATYYDTILVSKATVVVTQIAQDYGMSAIKFNSLLKKLHIQHKVGGQWILYSDHQGKGYVHSKTIDITHKDGTHGVTMQTEWTQNGRLFLYEILKKNGILPLIERGIA